jgi:hypothetical protein
MAYQEPEVPTTGTVISSANFGIKVVNSIIWLKSQIDALLAQPLIFRRQGGSSTVNATGGTTNYTPTSSKTQVGVYRTSWGGVNPVVFTITFPVAFTEAPIFLIGGMTLISGSYAGVSHFQYSSLTKTSVEVTWTATTMNSPIIDLPWMAIEAS